MNYCKKCGKEIEEGMTLCRECEVNEILFGNEGESVAQVAKAPEVKTAEVKQPEVKQPEVKAEVKEEKPVVAKAKMDLSKGGKIALILGIVSILLAVFAKIWSISLTNNATIINYSWMYFEQIADKIGFGEDFVEGIFELLYKMVKIDKATAFFYGCAIGMMNIGFITSILGGLLGLIGIKRYKKEASVCDEKTKTQYLYLIIGVVLSVIAILYIAANYMEMNSVYWHLMAYYGI